MKKEYIFPGLRQLQSTVTWNAAQSDQACAIRSHPKTMHLQYGNLLAYLLLCELSGHKLLCLLLCLLTNSIKYRTVSAAVIFQNTYVSICSSATECYASEQSQNFCTLQSSKP